MKYTFGLFVQKLGHPNTDVFWPRYWVYNVSTAGTTVIDVITGNTVWQNNYSARQITLTPK